MHGKYILSVLVLLLLIYPSVASTKVIAAGAPVYIGESDLDLNKALDNCRIIAWWPEGSDIMSGTGVKNITVRPQNEISPVTSHYTISYADFKNYTGTWYCEERQPRKAVFVVYEPRVRLYVWDMDKDRDVTGTFVPADANITYRIETNLDRALLVRYRPEINPQDSFWMVLLTDPYGKSVTNIYSGTYGAKNTIILSLDKNPFLTSSPYIWNFWKTGGTWNRAAKNTQGSLIYPLGTYRFAVSQNLNGMADTYKAAGIMNTTGILSSSAEVTFVQPVPVTPIPTALETVPVTTLPATMPLSELPTTTGIPLPGTTVPAKTVYQPLPAWIVFAGLGIGAFVALAKR